MERNEETESYEGKTQRLHMLCPMCNGAMEAGYLLDRGDSSSMYQGEWAAGEPQRYRWMGGILKTRRVRRFAITIYRCETCGFLAPYAMTPLNDVQ